MLLIPVTANAAVTCPLNGQLNVETGACTAPSGVVYVYAGDSAPTGFGCSQGYSLWQIQSGGTVGGGSMLDPATGNSYQCFGTNDGSASTEPPTGKGKVVTPGTTSCEGATNQIINLPVCIFRAAMAGLGSVLITLTAWLLQIAGIVFNWLLYYTVVAFGAENGFLTPKVLDAINAAWTVFRDIANILIIGLFTFIAISTILGNHEFGAKKMLAKALIIAVLINFSLLFTKMIVDGSNFFAYQFYNAAGGLKGNSASPVGELSSTQSVVTDKAIEFKQDGIAGRFINYLGVTSIGNTFNTLKTGADNVNNGWVAILHGVFSATLLLGVALVLLYGSFLLVARAILIVFLLITSSLAFASYLLPASMQSTYGWSMWWNSLLKSAVFAPLLMMFLWVTMSLADKLRPPEGSLGALINDPTNASNMSALFGYIIILGLLFASFKISSSFSTKIAGFNFAAMIPAIGLATGARVAAFAGRQTIGRASMAVSDRLKTAAGNEKSSMFVRRMADFGSQRFKSVAKQDFNVTRTPLLGTAVSGTAGIKEDVLAGKKVGGFEGSEEAKAHRIAEQARRMAPNAATQAKIVSQAIEAELKKDPDLAHQHKQATEEHKTATTEANAEQETLSTMHEKHTQEMRTLHNALEEARNSGDAGAVTSAEERVAEARQTQAQAIEEQTVRIKRANDAVTHATNQIDRVKNVATQRAIDTGRLGGNLKINSKGEVEGFQSAAKLAGALVKSGFTSSLFTKAENERLARMAGHEVGVQDRRKKVKELHLAEAIAGLEGGEAPPAGAPAARTPTPAAAPAANVPPPAAGGAAPTPGH